MSENKILRGRAVISRKWRVDEALSIDSKALKLRAKPGRMIVTDHIVGGRVVGNLAYYKVDEWTLRIHFPTTNGGICEFEVKLSTTPCGMGGRTHWFSCPKCLRRCRYIYLPLGESDYACRFCHKLTYESQQRHREAFYENFVKPMKLLERAKDLSNVRSIRTRRRLKRNAELAEKRVARYLNKVERGLLSRA